MPPQMRRAGFSPRAVAQEEHRAARLCGPQAEAPAGLEVEELLVPRDIGDDGRHRLAGNGLLGGPEQFHHGGRTHEDQGRRIEPEAEQPRSIGQAELLRLVGQLQIDDRHALARQEPPRLPQGKAKARAHIAAIVGKHFLQQAAGQFGELPILGFHPLPGLGQGRLALDIGNGVPQRGEALLVIGRGHRAIPCEQNRNI